MNNFVVSHNEWKYLIDIFQNPEVDTNINQELFESLEIKKYIDFDFDGNINIDEELSDLIRICFNSTKQLAFTSFLKQGQNLNYTYFSSAKGNVLLIEEAELYTLKKISKTETDKFFSELLERLYGNYTEFKEKDVLVSDLKKIKEDYVLTRSFKSIKELNDLFGQEVSTIIAQALTVGKDYYSIISIEKDFENTKINNLIFISNGKYLIEVSPTIIDLNDSIQFKGVSYEYIKNKIDILKI